MAKNSFAVSQGQAWDQAAKENYGTEKSMGVLLPANEIEMDALLFSGEVRLDIPEIEIPAVKSLPPWERM